MLRPAHATMPLLATLLLSTCPLYAMTAADASIIPGADIVGRIAIKEANSSQIAINRKAAQETEGKQLRRELEARKARLETATGLTEDDLISLAFSCDIDTANLKEKSQRAALEPMNALAVLEVAKPLSIAKLKQAIKLEYGNQDLAGVSDINIAGQPALKINASQPDNPDIYITTASRGHLLLLALNTKTIANALQRITARINLAEPKELTKVRSNLPPKSQIQIVGNVPPSVRATIDEQIELTNQQAATNPGLAVFVGIAKLFQGLQNIGLGVHLDNDAHISIAATLGSNQEATQAGIMLENMIIPMIFASLMQQAGEGSPSIDEMVDVNINEDTIQINLHITEKQIMSAVHTTQTEPASPSVAPTTN